MPNEVLALAYTIRRLDQGLYRTIRRHLSATSTVTYRQFIVLATINVLERPSPADVAHYLYQTRASVLPPINASVERGYIERLTEYSRSRESVLYITEKGSRKLEETKASCVAALHDIWQPGESWSKQLQWLQQIDHRLARHSFPSHLL